MGLAPFLVCAEAGCRSLDPKVRQTSVIAPSNGGMTTEVAPAAPPAQEAERAVDEMDPTTWSRPVEVLVRDALGRLT